MFANVKNNGRFLLVLALTFLFLFSGSVYGVDYQDDLYDSFNNSRVHCTYDLRLQIKQRGSFF